MVHYHFRSTESLQVAGSGYTQVFAVAWKPGQHEVLACATSRGGKIINMGDQEVVMLGTDRTRMTIWVAWSPSGDLLVTLGEQNIIWNSDGGKVVTLLTQPRGIKLHGSLPKFSPSGSLVAISHARFFRYCDVYDTITGEMLLSVNCYGLQNAVVWKDEIHFFCSGADPDTINLWKVDQDQDEPIDVIRETHINGRVMAYNLDKDMLAFSGFQGAIWLYSSGVTTGVPTGTFNGHDSDRVVQLIWKPDFKGILASRSFGGQVRIWDALAKTNLHTYEMAITPLILGKFFYGLSKISFSPDWKFLASVGLDRNVKIMKVDTGETVAEFEEKGVGVGWSSYGDQLALKPANKLRTDQAPNTTNVSVYTLDKVTKWKNLKVLSTMRVASLLEMNFNKDEATEFLVNKEGFPPALVPDVCAYLPRN